MSRDRINIIILAGGIIFLLFFWTHRAFVSSADSASASTTAIQEKTEKAIELQMKAMTENSMHLPADTGLFSFIETTAKMTGTSERLSGMKPKQTDAAEAASFRLDSLTLNETAEFIRRMEEHSNIRLTTVKINRRFDNEKRLNLYIEAEKI